MREPNNEKKMGFSQYQGCLMLIVSVFNVPILALTDTGSQITCISENFYHYLTKHKKISELPVTNVLLSTAIGKKMTRIKKQVLLNITIGDYNQQTSFLVVPGLSKNMILGNDWLLNNRAVLDYKNYSVILDSYLVSRKLTLYGRVASERILSSYNDNFTFVQVVDISNVGVRSVNKKNGDRQCRDGFDFHNEAQKNIRICRNIVEDKKTGVSGKLISNRKNYHDLRMHNKCDYNEKQILVSVKDQLVYNNSIDFFGDLDNGNDNVFEILYKIDDFDGNEISINSNNESEIDVKNNKIDDTNTSCENNNMEDDRIIHESDLTEIELSELNLYEINQINAESQSDFFDGVKTIANALTTCNSEERDLFINTISKFKSLFSKKIGHAGNYEYSLKIRPHKIFIKNNYPVPLKYRDSVKTEIERMLQAGIIERSTSSYCSPLRIVQKSDNTIRICLDARDINNIIESENEAPPIISDITQKFHGIQYISTSDLANGYWQIPLHKDSRQYTAFLFDGVTYHFCRIPFGIKTAGSGFIRALKVALGNKFDPFLTTYIDDLLITTAGSFRDHMRDLSLVFSILQDLNFTLRLDKSLFCRDCVRFLGFRLSLNGIEPDPDKLNVIRNFEEPKSRSQLQSFLGICNYYRQFIARYSNYLDPFRDILRQSDIWEWTDDHRIAFTEMKQRLADSIMLEHYIPGIPFKLQTDASIKGISGILYQTTEDGNQHVNTMVSRCLSIAETHYSTTELELLAIIYSISKCRTYLLGTKFEIITDHQALIFLNKAQFHSSRLIRWCIVLQQYDFNIKHCIGRENIIADFFSRNPAGRFEEEDRNTVMISELVNVLPLSVCELKYKSINMEPSLIKEFKNIKIIQNEDEYIKNIKANINNEKNSENFIIYEGILFRIDHSSNNYQLVLPSILSDGIIDYCHVKLGHPGYYKTLMYVRQFFYWKGMMSQIKKFVTSCDMCQRVKFCNYRTEGEYQFVKSDQPGELVTVDFFGSLPQSVGGVAYIFVVMDAYSKYVKLYAIKRETTRIALNKLFDKYIPEVGKPMKILSDNGTQFTSPLWSKTLQDANIKTVFCSIRHPQSNPTERIMRELGRLFRTLCSDSHTRWAKHLPEIEYYLNMTTHSSTGFSPHELHFGVKPTDQIQKLIQFPELEDVSHEAKLILARKNLLSSYERRKLAQKNVSKIDLKIDDLVLLRVPKKSDKLKGVTEKFFHLYYGPYKISQTFGNNAFELVEKDNSDSVIGIYNRCSLKKYNDRNNVI